MVQFLPLVLIPLILSLYPSKVTPSHYVWGVLALYLLAKAAEVLDVRIYTITGGLSGHTLKHLVAAVGVYLFCRAVTRRNFRSREHHA